MSSNFLSTECENHFFAVLSVIVSFHCLLWRGFYGLIPFLTPIISYVQAFSVWKITNSENRGWVVLFSAKRWGVWNMKDEVYCCKGITWLLMFRRESENYLVELTRDKIVLMNCLLSCTLCPIQLFSLSIFGICHSCTLKYKGVYWLYFVPVSSCQFPLEGPEVPVFFLTHQSLYFCKVYFKISGI